MRTYVLLGVCGREIVGTKERWGRRRHGEGRERRAGEGGSEREKRDGEGGESGRRMMRR